MVSIFSTFWCCFVIITTLLSFNIEFTESASNYIIDEFDEIYLPFGFDRCQHHSPVGTYVEYSCANSTGAAWKQFWEDELCPGNWSSRSLITDDDSEESTSSNIAATSNADDLYCEDDNNLSKLSIYCDFEVPAQRQIYLATDVCVDLIGDGSMYVKLTCDTSTDDATVYFWNNGYDCSGGTKNAIKRVLQSDECNTFLNDSETNLGYSIFAQSLECIEESKGKNLNFNFNLNLIMIVILSMVSILSYF